jgi:hypothetical protein
VKVGVELHFRTEKNKTFPPLKAGSFSLFNQDVPQLGRKKGEVDNFEQMVEYGSQIGAIAKGGAWYDLEKDYGADFRNPDEKNGKFQGLESVIAFLKNDPKKAEKIREKVFDMMKTADHTTIPSGDEEEG